MKNFDVMIIGAGTAGSFAAELMAKGGAGVELLAGSRGCARRALWGGLPPGSPKSCGGGVTAKALKAWPQLLNAAGRTITELDLYSPSRTKLRLDLEEPFAIYSRIAFDCYLRDRARDAGAHVISEKISARGAQRAEPARRRASRGRAHHLRKNLGAESKESRLGLAREK